MTITEALAEIKLTDRKIHTKHEAVARHLIRDEAYRDPLTKEGGSAEVVKRELQAVHDLELRRIDLRQAINKTNLNAWLEVDGEKRSVSWWLAWRREVAPQRAQQLKGMAEAIMRARSQGLQKRMQLAPGQLTDTKAEIAVSVDESWLMRQIQHVDTALQELDGKLSLFNATVQVEV